MSESTTVGNIVALPGAASLTAHSTNNMFDSTTAVVSHNYCAGCGQYYNGYTHTCWSLTPAPSAVTELMAWIDGYTQDRPLTAKRLSVIRKKLREFCE